MKKTLVLIGLGLVIAGGGGWIWMNKERINFQKPQITPTPIAEEISTEPSPTKVVVKFEPVAEYAGEIMPFVKKSLEEIKVINGDYPSRLDTKEWTNNDNQWVEGMIKVQEGTKFLRWSGDFGKPTATIGGLYHSDLGMKLVWEATVPAQLSEYAIAKTQVEVDRIGGWVGRVRKWTFLADTTAVKKALVKVSEVQAAVDELAWQIYGGYLNRSEPEYHFTGKKPNAAQMRECTQYKCVNGINMDKNIFWDAVTHRLLVYMRWDGDLSEKGCGEEYKSVYGVVVVDPVTPRVEKIYLNKSPMKMECPDN